MQGTYTLYTGHDIWVCTCACVYTRQKKETGYVDMPLAAGPAITGTGPFRLAQGSPAAGDRLIGPCPINLRVLTNAGLAGLAGRLLLAGKGRGHCQVRGITPTCSARNNSYGSVPASHGWARPSTASFIHVRVSCRCTVACLVTVPGRGDVQWLRPSVHALMCFLAAHKPSGLSCRPACKRLVLRACRRNLGTSVDG